MHFFAKLTIRSLFGIAAVSALSACGTRVPSLAESGRAVDSEELVHAVVRSVHCELRNAVNYVRNQDIKLAAFNRGIRTAQWLDTWGAQVGLTLTVEEKTSLNPTAVWLPPSPPTAIFTVATNGTASTGATRINKLNYYYTVKELYQRGSCADGDMPENASGSLLIQSDLKLREWLVTAVLEAGTGQIKVPSGPASILKQSVLSHQVKFEVVTSGTVVPGWKLVRATFNQTGTFFTTSRTRTHDLLITFGPVDPKTGELSNAASASFLASQIGIAVSRGSTP